MSESNKACSDLLAQLSQLSKQHLSSESLPTINDSPTTSADVYAFCKALINEGTRHSTELWAAHMTPSASSASILGQVLAGLHNGNLLSSPLYPLLHQIEQQLLDWFCQLFQQQHGHFTAGATYSNLEALWQAREHSSNNTQIVFASAACHYSIAKACQILGLKLQTIATDEYDRMLTSALEQACENQAPVAIVLTAGTSACGEIDPICECIKISKKYNSWSHIDAAWGGALALLDKEQSLINDMAAADSLCVDPHKAFGQAKPCGVLLYQRPLQALFEANANYLEQQPQKTLSGSYGGELFLPLWSDIMFNGVDTLRKDIQQRLSQATQFATQLSSRSDWWLHHSATGIVCFQPKLTATDKLDKLVIQGLFSKAKVNGRKVYRAVFASPNTQAETLLTALEPFL
jgi:glutamate/tyrosine decarboxylase-like PLP-dependent enzyme